MRTILLFFLTITLFIPTSIRAHEGNDRDSLDLLQKEVTALFRKNEIPYPDIGDQKITVGFLINARNELIILDVDCDSADACTYVKEVLSYKKVKFNQARQLTRYEIKLQLVKQVE
ncbi:MAG: hypothetical protein ABIQ11_10120 [Saprospiraceae bacterium]